MNDDDIILKMLEAFFCTILSREVDRQFISDHSKDMARVLAVVRAHDAPAAKRVPVQIATEVSDGSPAIICLASDHTLHQGWWESGKFTWREILPPLPQRGGEA